MAPGDVATELLDKVRTPVDKFSAPGERIFVLYLAAAIGMAVIIVFLQRRAARKAGLTPNGSWLAALFPRAIYWHRSARVDYLFYAVNAVLFALAIAPLLTVFPLVYGGTMRGLEALFGPGDVLPLSTGASIAFTFGSLLANDLGFYIGHTLTHRVPILWELHKVHHSAEVLNPLTALRFHPLDDYFLICTAQALHAVVAAVIFYLVDGSVPLIAVYGVNIGTFLFYLVGYNLRHSHVWLSYGPVLSRLLISPAQHQIHHSKEPRHWDKNMGFIFAFWDWAGGTLYVPREREQFELGLPEGEDREYSNVLRLYTLPLTKIFRRLVGKARAPGDPNSGDR